MEVSTGGLTTAASLTSSGAVATVANTTVSPTPISDAVQRGVDVAMGKIPAGKRGAVEGWMTLDGVQASFGWKLNDSVDVAAWGARNWSGEVAAGGRIRYTF